MMFDVLKKIGSLGSQNVREKADTIREMLSLDPVNPVMHGDELAPRIDRTLESAVYAAHSAPFLPRRGGPAPAHADFSRQILARPASTFGNRLAGHIWSLEERYVAVPDAVDVASFLKTHDGRVDLQAVMPRDILWASENQRKELRLFARGIGSEIGTLRWRRGNITQNLVANSSQGAFRVEKQATVNNAVVVAASMIDLGDLQAATLFVSRCPGISVVSLTDRLDCGDMFSGEGGLQVASEAIFRIVRRSFNGTSKFDTTDLYESAVVAISEHLKHDAKFEALATSPTIANTPRHALDEAVVRNSDDYAVMGVRSIFDDLLNRQIQARTQRNQFKFKQDVWGNLHPKMKRANKVSDGDYNRECAQVILAVVLAGAARCGRTLKTDREKKMDHISLGLAVIFAGLGLERVPKGLKFRHLVLHRVYEFETIRHS